MNERKEPVYVEYSRIAEASPAGSLQKKVANALRVWWRGSNGGGQSIGRAGEVIPLAQTMEEILRKLQNGELIEIKKN